MPNVSYPNQATRNAALKQNFLGELKRLIDRYCDIVKVKDMSEYHVELMLLR